MMIVFSEPVISCFSCSRLPLRYSLKTAAALRLFKIMYLRVSGKLLISATTDLLSAEFLGSDRSAVLASSFAAEIFDGCAELFFVVAPLFLRVEAGFFFSDTAVVFSVPNGLAGVLGVCLAEASSFSRSESETTLRSISSIFLAVGRRIIVRTRVGISDSS